MTRPAVISPRVGIVVLGTRGDVEPHVALAQRLTDLGAHPVIVGFADEGRSVAEQGIEYRAIPVRLQDVLGTADGQTFLTTGNPIRLLKAQRDLVAQTPPELVERITESVADCQALVAGGPTSAPALFSAEALGIGSVMTMLQPMYPSDHLAPFIVARGDAGPANRMLWSGMLRAQWILQHELIEDWRRSSGLAPFGSFAGFRTYVLGQQVVGAWSPTLLPAPSDWPKTVRLTGRMVVRPETRALTSDPGAKRGEARGEARGTARTEAGTEAQSGARNAGPRSGAFLDPQIEEFLADGPPPVYAGLGSMVVADPRAVTRMITEAVRATGCRLILGRGWSGLGEATGAEAVALGDDVLVVGPTSHAALFPRCQAVIHHAGAGTTQTTAAAGVPAVPLPFGMDQPFWANLVHRRGIAGRPVPIRRWSTDRIAASLQQALEPTRVRRAERVGLQMASEPDGAFLTAEQVMRLI